MKTDIKRALKEEYDTETYVLILNPCSKFTCGFTKTYYECTLIRQQRSERNHSRRMPETFLPRQRRGELRLTQNKCLWDTGQSLIDIIREKMLYCGLRYGTGQGTGDLCGCREKRFAHTENCV